MALKQTKSSGQTRAYFRGPEGYQSQDLQSLSYKGNSPGPMEVQVHNGLGDHSIQIKRNRKDERQPHLNRQYSIK